MTGQPAESARPAPVWVRAGASFGSLADNPGETHGWASTKASFRHDGGALGGPGAPPPDASQVFQLATLNTQNTLRPGGRWQGSACPASAGQGGPFCKGSYLVDPASSHMLVSKIKPCMSKYKLLIL